MCKPKRKRRKMKAKPVNPSLPQDLIIAILVRLPVKYLLQFNCVSKSWLTLISSPDFVKAHLRFSAKDCTRHRLLLGIEKYCPSHGCRLFKHCSVSSLFNDDSVTESFDLDHPINAAKRYVRIVGSVNGLICLRIWFKDLFVWNPSTRKLKRVPDRLLPRDRCGYGFGYDEVRDDYKIVVTSFSFPYVDSEIYSLKRDSWKMLGLQCRYFIDDSPKFVNRRLHWLTSSLNGWGIMSFDLVDEKYRNMELPCYEEINYCRLLKLGALENYFSVFCNFTGDNEINHTDVWVMKEYGVKESWMKQYSFKYPCDDNYLMPSPLCIYKGEIASAAIRVTDSVSTFVIYNPEDGSRRYQKVTNTDGHVTAEHYFESLVCPILQSKPPVQR